MKNLSYNQQYLSQQPMLAQASMGSNRRLTSEESAQELAAGKYASVPFQGSHSINNFME